MMQIGSCIWQTKLNALRESHTGMILQSQMQEELDALLPSVLDKAFNPYRVLREGKL